MKRLSEMAVFAQEISEEELEGISGGLCGVNGYECSSAEAEYHRMHCTEMVQRDIREGQFPNCAATVEDGSFCSTNDACATQGAVKYANMWVCHRAFE